MMEMVDSRLVETLSYAENFPSMPSLLIDRSNITQTISELFKDGTEVVILNGPEGIGLTTLLASFALANEPNSFALFVKPASRLSYSIDHLRQQLSEQLHQYIYSSQLEAQYIDESEFSNLIRLARRRAANQQLYLVVDGIHQIRSDAVRVSEIFRDALPLGRGIKLLIAGKKETFQNYLAQSKMYEFHVPYLSETESRALLAEIEIEERERIQILKLCNNTPGRISSVKRLIESGLTAEQILSSDPRKYLQFLNMEFRQITFLTETQKRILASVTFALSSPTFDELINVVPEATETDIVAIRNKCPFLRQEGNNQFEYISSAHRSIAEQELEIFRNDALHLQVQALIKDPSGPAAVRLLPAYYASLKKLDRIIELISKDHYGHLLETTQSITALQARAALGVRSAVELKQASQTFRFALERAMFRSISDMDELESEVAALVALGNKDDALAIAAQPATKEKRLFMLAEYSKKMRESGAEIDSQIKEYIVTLASDVDFAELGEAGMRLAENLMSVDPDLALSVSDEVLKSSTSSIERDAEYARMSISAMLSVGVDAPRAATAYQARINDERLRFVISSFASISDGFSLDNVKKLVEPMRIDRRIYFIRQLCLANAGGESVLDLVDYALDEILANLLYSPKARDFADLAMPLSEPSYSTEKIIVLIKRIEGQITPLEAAAPSSDLVRLQMNLAHALYAVDQSAANDRILQTYYSVAEMANIDNKILCLSQMSEALGNIDRSGDLERREGFRASILHDLKDEISRLLESTANHYKVALPALRAMCKVDLNEALKIAKSLNTESRRDNALHEIVIRIIALEKKPETKAIFFKVFDLISSEELRSLARQSAAEALSRSQYAEQWLSELLVVTRQETSPTSACECSILIVGSLKNLLSAVIESGIKIFDLKISQVESLPLRVDLLFRFSAAIARHDKSLAQKYYKNAREDRSKSAISGHNSASVIASCLSLITRVFRGMINNGELGEDFTRRFQAICDAIPCPTARSEVYSDLACKAWCEGSQDFAKSILEKACIPLLENMRNSNPRLHSELCELWFPAAFCVHQSTALQMLECMSTRAREASLFRTARLIISRVPPFEEVDDNDQIKSKLTLATLNDVVVLLEHATTDIVLCSIIHVICLKLKGKDSYRQISAGQRIDFLNKVGRITESKLPDPKNIKHNGYVIVAKCEILMANESQLVSWLELKSMADNIANVSDRVLILQQVASCMPSKFMQNKKDIMAQAYSEAKTIPSAFDKFSRIEAYINYVKEWSPSDAKSALAQAMHLTFEQVDGDDGSGYRRKLVDLAEAIDSESLADIEDMLDDDPARGEARRELQKEVEVSKLRRRIADTGETEDIASHSKELPTACWKNLRALVSGRLETKQPERMISYLSAAANMQFADAYPVLSWYTENCARRYRTGPDTTKHIEPLAEVLLLSTEIAIATISSSTVKSGAPRISEILQDSKAEIVILPGNRDAAILFIRGWLRKMENNKIIYCDPYFSQSDIELLRIVLSEKPDSSLQIITYLTAVTAHGAQFNPESFYAEWQRLVDQDPPETEIVAVNSNEQKGLPHDRWLIVGDSGLTFGTSFNSLGEGKASVISELSKENCRKISSELDQFFQRKRYVNGQRITYSSVSL